MFNEAEAVRAKEAQYNAELSAKCGAGRMGGTMGLDPFRPSLYDRVAGDVDRARRESRKYEQLLELQHLLEKNPEIARILDLLELVRG